MIERRRVHGEMLASSVKSTVGARDRVGAGDGRAAVLAVHEPSGAVVNVVSDVTSPRELPIESKAWAV